MNTGYNVEHKILYTAPWRKEDVIAFEVNKGWLCVRTEKMLDNKIAIIFQKIVPIPQGSNPENEVKKYLDKNK